jgi:NAD(P)-dependent dehydrogenase (short-subunit alcohol dehydrogenase family)
MAAAQSAHHPAQEQDRQPGRRSEMVPKPRSEMRDYRAAGKLEGKAALITGGDSGIGRAVAIGFAKEGADVAIVYLDEHEDAASTRALVEEQGRRCIIIAGDIGDEAFCGDAVARTVEAFGRLDLLVNNAAEQHPQDRLEDISAEQLERTFRTNLFAMFHVTKAALAHLPPGAAVINSASVTAYRGSSHLIDYASTKGAIVAFTRSLAENLKERPGQRGRAGPGLDAADPSVLPGRTCGALRRGHLSRSAGGTG